MFRQWKTKPYPLRSPYMCSTRPSFCCRNAQAGCISSGFPSFCPCIPGWKPPGVETANSGANRVLHAARLAWAAC
jgi:pectin methylesterase-like acyl-CoA thioesterase